MSIQNTTINIVLNYVNLNRLQRSLAGIVGLNPAGGMNVLSQVNVVYCLCYGPIPRPEESCRVSVSRSVISRNNNR
jgi:hypothetical protein